MTPPLPCTIRQLWPLLLLAACAGETRRDTSQSRRAERDARKAPVQYDTAVYVAELAGAPAPPISSVMQLRVGARDAQVTVENPAGQQALAGALGSDALQEIPGSRASTTALASGDSAAAEWHAMVSVPVLEGERYLVELYPSSRRVDSVTVELSADDHPLMTTRVATDATDGTPPLFEVVVGAHTLSVSPQIERVEIVPTCGTTHVVRFGGRADLYAQFEVTETGESGDVHLLPRARDALFRGVTFRTRTRGGVRISYLGHELATAAMPEGCPAAR